LFFEFELLHRQNSPDWVDLQSRARPIPTLVQHHLFLLIQDYLRNVTISSADKFQFFICWGGRQHKGLNLAFQYKRFQVRFVVILMHCYVRISLIACE
jgi:hypothetical protein